MHKGEPRCVVYGPNQIMADWAHFRIISCGLLYYIFIFKFHLQFHLRDTGDFFDQSSKVKINQEDSDALSSYLRCVVSLHTNNPHERVLEALKLFFHQGNGKNILALMRWLTSFYTILVQNCPKNAQIILGLIFPAVNSAHKMVSLHK